MSTKMAQKRKKMCQKHFASNASPYVNLVTGHIDYRPWTTTDDTFDAVTSPVIPGYTADKLVVPAVSGVKAGDADLLKS